MTNGALVGEIVAIADSRVIVKTTTNGVDVYGTCLMPSLQGIDPYLFFSTFSGQKLTIVTTQTADGLVGELLVSGTPLLHLRQQQEGHFVVSANYPWGDWNALPSVTWAESVHQFTHSLVGIVVVVCLLFFIGVRAHHHPTKKSFWRTAFGGFFGRTADSFSTSVTLPIKNDKGHQP